MISNCCVLIECLLNIFCKVRGVTPILSASHSFVWPCRRNSSRIREPICICMVVCYLCAMLPIPQIPTTNKKRRRTISSPHCGRRNYLRGKMKNARLTREHLPILLPLNHLEISYVSVWSEQIANAMIYNILVSILISILQYYKHSINDD